MKIAMPNLRNVPLLAAVAMLLVCGSALIAQRATPATRIIDRIDEGSLVALRGNTHPAANARNDRGRVSAGLPMTGLVLVMSRDPAQQAAFEQFVASQYDKNSPNFHHWLTPEQVGENFGPSESDLATATNWLTGHGFSVDQISKDRLSIRFSGNASQVQSAFHTEIHNLEVKGEKHIGNMSDPQIPAALSTAVVGVKALHNFFPRPLHHLGSKVSFDSESGKWLRPARTVNATQPAPALATQATIARSPKAETIARPQFGISVTGANAYLVEDVAPYDFATIYNILPLWNAGIDGTGQTIAIAGTSDILDNDVATFRTFFGLPTTNAANTPIHISGNGQPLTVCSATTLYCGQGDLMENSLDVEWSGSVAKNAQIVMVSSYPSSPSDDGLYDSESYIVDHLTARILNVSYGLCELGNGTAGNVQYYNLWQTAAAEGIAVFVASGDSGAASCDQGGDANGIPYVAQYGLTVSGLASTPYNTAVGGTDFKWCELTTPLCTAAPYWKSTNDAAAGESTAIGYVPEVPWNDTCTSPAALGFMQYYFTGIVNVTDAETGCNALVNYAQQIYGNGQGADLYLVDTVGGSGGASACVTSSSSSTTTGTCTAGATSTGATTIPGGTVVPSIPLSNNGWQKPVWQTGVAGIPNDGVRDLPDVSFFASDGFLSSSAYLICVSQVATCSYSSKTVPFAQEVGGTSVATPAMAGVMALINQKAGAAQGSPNAELYALAAQQSYAGCSAETVSTSSNCFFNDIDTGTIAMACSPGSPDCNVAHSGDIYAGILGGYSAGAGYDLATGLGSLNVANVVNAWPPISGGTAVIVAVTPSASDLIQSQSFNVTGTVSSSVGGGSAPSGTATIVAGVYSSVATLSGTGAYSFIVPANSMGTGTDTINVSYSGDSTYSTGDGTAFVTVEPTGVTYTLAATAPAAITPGGSAVDTVTVTAVGGYTGTVTLTCQLLSTTATGGDGATCSGGGTSTPVVLSSGTTSGAVLFTIGTTAPIAELVQPRLPGRGPGWLGAGGGAVLAFLIFLGVPARRRSWRQMLGVLIVMAALGTLAGCGGGGDNNGGGHQSDPGTTAGVYTFKVQATGNPSVSPAVSTTFSVTVN